jgi:hypothetical protein
VFENGAGAATEFLPRRKQAENGTLP